MDSTVLLRIKMQLQLSLRITVTCRNGMQYALTTGNAIFSRQTLSLKHNSHFTLKTLKTYKYLCNSIIF